MSFMDLDLDRKIKGAYLQIRLLVSIPNCFSWPYRILSYPLRGEANIITPSLVCFGHFIHIPKDISGVACC